jgi:hypothetical protein
MPKKKSKAASKKHSKKKADKVQSSVAEDQKSVVASERKVVSQTPSSQKQTVSSGGNSNFLMKCHLVMNNISNLALGDPEVSSEKISKIMKILGIDEAVD